MRPGFDPRPVNAGYVMDPVNEEFVVDEMALERVLLPWLLRCSHAFHYCLSVYTQSFVYHIRYKTFSSDSVVNPRVVAPY